MNCESCRHWHRKQSAGAVLLGTNNVGECRGAPPLQTVLSMDQSGHIGLSPPFWRMVPGDFPACGMYKESLSATVTALS